MLKIVSLLSIHSEAFQRQDQTDKVYFQYLLFFFSIRVSLFLETPTRRAAGIHGLPEYTFQSFREPESEPGKDWLIICRLGRSLADWFLPSVLFMCIGLMANS